MKDTFLSQTNCDRCSKNLSVRMMSWFTKETLCMDCIKKEDVIKKALRAKGIKDAMEGCGFVPDPDKITGVTT